MINVYFLTFSLVVIACENTIILPTTEHNVSKIDCVPITTCPAMYKLLQKRPVSRETMQFIMDSGCGFDKLIQKVWCPELEFRADNDTSTESITIPAEASTIPNIIKKYSVPIEFPKIGVCGHTGVEPNKIFGGEATEIDEHPWSALLLVERPNGKVSSRCGGVLISDRHVLTAAHCIRTPPSMVLLGEYDTSTDKDCVSFFDGGEDCADPPVMVSVESIFVHSNFLNPGKGRRPFYDDIALIKLKKTVEFTDFIKPICLPMPGQKLEADTFTVTGWGRTENGTKAHIKQKVILPKVASENCTVLLKRKIEKGQLCAGGEEGKDACVGDSGGPIMYYDFIKDYWILAGVVSLGAKGCAIKNVPGVYTYVPEYLDWIYQNANK